VVVATDDDRIFNHVKAFGGKAVMTADTHQSGTDRCAEVAMLHPEYDVIINIQGDEPFIDPEQISKASRLLYRPGTQLATLIKRITTEELSIPIRPKVIINKLSRGYLFFALCPIPTCTRAGTENWLEFITPFLNTLVFTVIKAMYCKDHQVTGIIA
jgi:3-deoxy-manno-octulosonate cytidylyltransferase (CMP-KDO synthetase)